MVECELEMCECACTDICLSDTYKGTDMCLYMFKALALIGLTLHNVKSLL